MSKIAVLEALTDEECYLWAILQDPAGLDLAEFCWHDPDEPTGTWRAWPFQWKWYRCVDPLQIDQAARSVGKSLSIKMRAFAFPFLYPGQEMVITAPELVHLHPITGLIETQFNATRLGRELLPTGRNRGITHRPFQIDFVNGARIIGRIPQRDGKGVKGLHPIWLELDEAQDYPEPGWIELVETLKRGHKGAVWRAHGVTKGVRDHFYKFTQDASGWTVHRITAMARPNWTDQERKEKIEQYGSKDHPDYRRNVLGLHGDATNPLFVLHRLMKCVDSDETSDYNADEYFYVRLSDEMLRDMGSDIELMLNFPERHHGPYKFFWAGMDVGYCASDDTEILTQRGWLKSTEVVAGDEALGINPTTGQSEWQAITSLYRERFDSIPMTEMKGQSFDALVTPHHKWLVKSENGQWRWRQTRTLNTKDCVPLSVPRGDLPAEGVYSDEFVELVAWFWTEGWWVSRSSIGIAQSESKNPTHTDRIRQLLKGLCGEPGAAYEPGTRAVAHNWREYAKRNGGVDFHIRGPVVEALRTVVGQNKVPTVAFLRSLTALQLATFIETSIDADGWRTPSGARKIEQRLEEGIRSFEIACALAGLPTSTSYSADRGRWHLSILGADTVRPVKAAQFPRASDQAMTVKDVDYSGYIWCPTVTYGNWLARRNGSVYFTGNTNHPSEILVFGEQRGQSDKKSKLKLLTRIHLQRINHKDQVLAILSVIGFYRPRAFAMDKMQPVSEPVLTPDGWRTMGDLKVGDSVIGSNGKPTLITGVYPQQDRRVWRVRCVDGSWTRCGPEHLWTVRNSQTNEERVVTTETLRGLVERPGQRKWHIPLLLAPVEFPEQELPLDPYLLGLLLGDGNLRERGVRFSSVDPEILAEIESRLPSEAVLKHTDRCNYIIKGTNHRNERNADGTWSHTNPVLDSLRNLGLAGRRSHEKFVPEQYLRGSVSQRLALLQGIMDSDGYVTVQRNSSHVGIRSSSEQLIRDIVQLVESFGGSARYGSHVTSCGGKAGKTAYRASIYMPSGYSPFRLERKRQAVLPRRPFLRFVDSVTEDGEEESRCIRVAAEDELYVTRHALVTHNTGLGLPLFQDIQNQAEANPRLKTIVDTIKGYNFSAKILVDFDQTVEVDTHGPSPVEDLIKEAGIQRNVLEYATDKLRELVDHERLILPWDRDLIGEFQGQTYTVVKTAMDPYGRRRYSQGQFHALDAARMAALGYAQHTIEEFVKTPQQEVVLDSFVW